ncbi:transglycosylase SLT domain-containing protein [Klebsiella pneumoniae]|uniref:Transglycosylase SLT domain-containing protein n=1 Tax=Klebsiella pneumoniae TaxID=573 RepID=A0A377XAA9_KLEPN|nr:transglycosylase SLT domain-containing protein [Klebsiella pneumoniae]
MGRGPDTSSSLNSRHLKPVAILFSANEQRFGLPAGLLGAVISKESSGNADAISKKGAIGLAQVMPNTARGMGYDRRS